MKNLGSQSFLRLKAHVEYCVEAGDFAGALDVLRHFVELVLNTPGNEARVLSSDALDALVRYVGENWRRAHPREPAPAQPGRSVILMTEALGHGGHIEVVKDLVRTGALGEVTVVLTDTFGRAQDQDNGLATLPGVRLEVVAGTTSQQRLERLDEMLHALAPGRIVVMVHHQDSTAVAALHAGQSAGEVLFVHHADHNLCLGASERRFRHVDLHPMGFHDCRERHHPANLYWPLVVRTPELDALARGFLAGGAVTTGTSGREAKFDATHYLYDYYELLPRMLLATGGRHVHIGPLSDAALERIRAGLQAAGIEPSRFRHVPWVPSLATALVQEGVDAYLPSFPLGGGKSLLEAMAVGIPLLMHENYRDRLLSGVDLGYPEAWVWRDEAELLDALRRLDRESLESHSRRAREWFRSHHHEQVLAAALASGGDNAALVAPLRPYAGNELQAFLDRTDSEPGTIDDAGFTPVDWSNLEQDVRRLSALAQSLAQQLQQRPAAPAAQPRTPRASRLGRVRSALMNRLRALKPRRSAG